MIKIDMAADQGISDEKKAEKQEIFLKILENQGSGLSSRKEEKGAERKQS